MHTGKISWIFFTVFILSASGAKVTDKRGKPLALNLSAALKQAQHEEENKIKAPEKVSEEVAVVETHSAGEHKNNSENINETIEETFQLLDTLEKDEEGHKEHTDVVAKPRPAFIGQIKDLLLHFVKLFGFVPTTNKRKHRNMNFLNDTENVLEDPSDFYQEQIRTTVGAALGRPDCIKRAACRAGKYLRGIKGKEIILVIMEKVTPTKWQETYRVVKDSAVHSNECHYKCLED